MDNRFKVIDEKGIERTADVVTAFTYNDKDYIVYCIERDEENTNIFVSYLVKDTEGYDTLKDIDDDKEREEVKKLVKTLFDKAEESSK